ncbi:uncharacterized protein LOC127000941 [Eriocheir sinensis]|uniref:uncharacterized protein LOC127000941 n=1 Tax=Eriocheir sinensis TaxID=95602 RepID=UPI0021CA856F|nr:uncharacterized protein LOC127000941 [Eriocheir sinensis]
MASPAAAMKTVYSPAGSLCEPQPHRPQCTPQLAHCVNEPSPPPSCTPQLAHCVNEPPAAPVYSPAGSLWLTVCMNPPLSALPSWLTVCMNLTAPQCTPQVAHCCTPQLAHCVNEPSTLTAPQCTPQLAHCVNEPSTLTAPPVYSPAGSLCA